MTVIATPTSNAVITSDDIRGFLRDVPGTIPGTGVTNILWDLPEFSDADIARALKFTIARVNIMTPISYDTVTSINAWLLLLGTSEFLMRSEATRQLRNQVTYSDGDIAPIGLDDKMQQYLVIANACKEEFEEKTKMWKIQRNMESCYGSLGSGYRAVSRFLHST